MNADGSISFLRDKYDFDYKPLGGASNANELGRLILRNAATVGGNVVSGFGSSFHLDQQNYIN
jgi:hypothetical protein